jgi:ribosome biogenesis GTPase
LEEFHPLLYERVITGIVPIGCLGYESEVNTFFDAYLKEQPQLKDAVELALEYLKINSRLRSSEDPGSGVAEKKNDSRSLHQMGWTSELQAHIDHLEDKAVSPGRITGVRKNSFYVSQGESERLATVAGKLSHKTQGLYPVTGDWVLLNETIIYEVLPRRNALSRGAAGSHGRHLASATQEQVIAANLDTVFIVCGLDRDFNIRRIERYLTLVYNCGLDPVVVLTKSDLHPVTEHFVSEVETVAFGVPVHLVSSKDSKGLPALETYLSSGKTVTMVGSSGAGKSTLVNRLYGHDIQTTGAVSESVKKGIHTTTTRDLIMMPQGGMVIDNPGIREIAFWDDDGGIDVVFPEIQDLSKSCRFSDCSHMHEPGCRVIKAVIDGEIVRSRLENYQKMKRELTYQSERRHKSSDRVEKERWKKVAKKIKAMKKR